MITLPYSKIEVIPPKDGERLTLMDVWYDEANRCLVAADGFMMAVVPVEADDGDAGGHVPLEAVKEARKATKGRAYLEAGDGFVSLPFAEGKKWTRPVWAFPDYRQIVPTPDEKYVKVTFDARRLMQLAEALCQEEDRAARKGAVNHDTWGVTLTFKPDGVSPILVHPQADNGKVKGRYGVLMPMHRHGGDDD